MPGPELRESNDLRIYKQHLQSIKNATAKVDNQAPRLPLRVYLNESSFFGDLSRLKIIERQNKELLKNINIIYRTKGKTECQLEKYKRQKTSFLVEKADLEKQRKKNEIFLNGLNLQFVKSTYNQEDSLKSWKNNLKTMKHSAKYPEFYDKMRKRSRAWSLCPEGYITNLRARKMCYMNIKVGDIPKKYRLEIEVYCDVVPATAENFVSLCRGDAKLTYRGSIFHRIVPGLLCIGGDIVNHTGTGGLSIYGPTFPDENFILQHNGPGVVAMYSTQPDGNNSQFIITFRKLTPLNGKFVVIGAVKNSKQTLEMIESCGTKSGKPRENVQIESCGLVGAKYESIKSSKSMSMYNSLRSTNQLLLFSD